MSCGWLGDLRGARRQVKESAVARLQRNLHRAKASDEQVNAATETLRSARPRAVVRRRQ
jgi:hypothetical protein